MVCLEYWVRKMEGQRKAGDQRHSVQAELKEMGSEDRGMGPRVSHDVHWLVTISGLVQVVLELAHLYLLQGHLDLCEQHCDILLQTEKNHEMASVVRGSGPSLCSPGSQRPHVGCFPAP